MSQDLGFPEKRGNLNQEGEISNDFPPEYTRGWVEFYYQKFVVNPSVLIPRLETESLVREAIKHCRANPPDILIDIGTGSGIIPLSILSVVDIPQVFAVDISPQALLVAEKNSETHEKNIIFLESDLLDIFLKKDSLDIRSKTMQKRDNSSVYGDPEGTVRLYGEGGIGNISSNYEFFHSFSNILLVTNLPYIKAEDWDNMSEDTRHEPKEALFGGEHTGFELYEELFDQIELFIKKYNPKSLTILAEMGEDQREVAAKALGDHGWKFSFFADLRGFERFMRIEVMRK